MWGMTAMKKGTSMKDKKKRAGGGAPPSTGTYPSVVGPGIDIGCMSVTLNPAGSHLHASVFLRDSQDAAGFLQITNAGGVNLNSPAAPEVEIADYIATAIQGETPINGGSGSAMQPGVIHTLGAPHNGNVTLVFRMSTDESTGAFGNGEFVDVAMVHNPSGVSITAINGSPPAQVAFTPGIPPTGQTMIEFGALSGGETVILEFKITGHAKAGNFSSAIISPPVSGSTLKVGSCYVQITFN